MRSNPVGGEILVDPMESDQRDTQIKESCLNRLILDRVLAA